MPISLVQALKHEGEGVRCSAAVALSTHTVKPLKKLGSKKNRVGNTKSGYIRYKVASDGNCGYTAFGITRQKAFTLLTEHLDEIKTILKPAILEQLLEEKFGTFLKERKAVAPTTPIHLQTEEHEGYAAFPAVISAFLEYDVKQGGIDEGWAHPLMLQALAHIQKIELHLWRLSPNQALQLHRGAGYDYAIYQPPGGSTQRTDLLFINGNHFERLELVNCENLPDEEPIYPPYSSRSQKLTVAHTSNTTLTFGIVIGGLLAFSLTTMVILTVQLFIYPLFSGPLLGFSILAWATPPLALLLGSSIGCFTAWVRSDKSKAHPFLPSSASMVLSYALIGGLLATFMITFVACCISLFLNPSTLLFWGLPGFTWIAVPTLTTLGLLLGSLVGRHAVHQSAHNPVQHHQMVTLMTTLSACVGGVFSLAACISLVSLFGPIGGGLIVGFPVLALYLIPTITLLTALLGYSVTQHIVHPIEAATRSTLSFATLLNDTPLQDTMSKSDLIDNQSYAHGTSTLTQIQKAPVAPTIEINTCNTELMLEFTAPCATSLHC